MKQDDLSAVVKILRKEISQWNEPVVSHYKQNPFTVLISCILSLRTKDKTTDAACSRLFPLAGTPAKIISLPTKKIEEMIYPVGFYHTKAIRLKQICKILLERYHGRVPDEIDELLKLPGVGRKTANLVVTLGYGKLGICVDTHVHRISNRLGVVAAKTPDKTEMALREILPRQYWIEFNDLLVTYGQNLCLPVSPWCSRCKISSLCAKTGVTTSR